MWVWDVGICVIKTATTYTTQTSSSAGKLCVQLTAIDDDHDGWFSETRNAVSDAC